MTPDLWCFGKVIGGGLPVGAFGGRRDVLAVLAPDGPVYQAGTLSGNPARHRGRAGRARGRLGRRLQRPVPACGAPGVGTADAITATGIEVQVPVVGPLVGLFFGEAPVTDYESARAAVAGGRYATFFSAMLERGVALAPGPYEAMFPGLAHLDSHLDAVVEAAAPTPRPTSVSDAPCRG